jgi:signal recognition particle subunit SRP54
MLPGNMGKSLAGAKIDEKVIAHTEAIILSMTPEERENPSILSSSRKKRIAAGSGMQVVDVNRLLKQYDTMKQLTRQMSKGKLPSFLGGGRGKRGGFPGF